MVPVGGECEEVRVPDLAEGWTRIEPGGDTICARGTPYAFWVRKGTVNKLVLYFMGGGACWNASTCALAGGVFFDTVSPEPEPGFISGIFELDNPENPFKDWYIVFMPYCTGDIHWGDNVVTYPATEGTEEVTIHHKGRVNATAAGDWVNENFNGPDFIFVSGCSAGSYGSALAAALARENYPAAQMAQLGDSGAGVVSDEFLNESFPMWKAYDNRPDWIPELADAALEDLSLAKVYTYLANHYPDDTYAQYNTLNDGTQAVFYQYMGGNPDDWGARMDASVKEIADNADNFRYYTAWGTEHCIMNANRFYTYQVNGVRFRDWVNDLANGVDVENVRCTDCETEELYAP
jgi:hypothetical protein